MIREVKNFEEYESLINRDKLVVLNFFATWCGPCKVVTPQFEALSEEYNDIEFVRIDVDVLRKAAELAKIAATPTFKFFKNGKELKEVVGANISLVKKEITDIKAEN